MKPLEKNRPSIVLTAMLVMTAFLVVGCKKPTEKERLSEFRGSVKYKTYHFASEQATKLAVIEYNKKSKKPMTEDMAHSTVALLWFLMGKSEYSFIESDIVATSSNEDAKLLSLGLQSVALSKMGYPNLSKSHYDELKTKLAARRGVDAESIELEHKVMLLSLIAVSLYQGDGELANFAADALSAVGEVDYLPPLVSAIVEAKKGNHSEALEDLEELNKSEKFSDHKKAIISDVADMIAKSSSSKTLGEDVINLIVIGLVERVLDDIFSTEEQQKLLEKTKALPELITGKEVSKPKTPDNTASSEVPEK